MCSMLLNELTIFDIAELYCNLPGIEGTIIVTIHAMSVIDIGERQFSHERHGGQWSSPLESQAADLPLKRVLT